MQASTLLLAALSLYALLTESALDRKQTQRKRLKYPLGAAVFLLDDWRKARDQFQTGPPRPCFFNKSVDLLQRFWRPSNPYPVVLLQTAEWSTYDQSVIRAKWPQMEFMFVDVSKEFNLYSEDTEFEDHAKPIDSLSYKRMCAFMFRGMFRLKALLRFRYLLRLDDDACIESEVKYDIFTEMRDNSLVYGFYDTMLDADYVTIGLYDLYESYIRDNNLVLPNPEVAEAVRSGRFAPDLNTSFPAFATHFEVIDTARYRMPDITKFMRNVTVSKMIFHRRWGDAPLRFVIALLFWGPMEVLYLADLTVLHWASITATNTTRSWRENPVLRELLVKWTY